MINIHENKDLSTIKSIITNPKLWELEYGQGMRIEDYKVDQTYKYLLIKEDDNILGCFQTREFTRILLEAHIYLLPDYWGKQCSLESLKALINYVKLNTNYQKILTDVPEVCKHVRNLLHKIGAEKSGYISNGVIYNNKLMGLYLYSYNVRK